MMKYGISESRAAGSCPPLGQGVQAGPRAPRIGKINIIEEEKKLKFIYKNKYKIDFIYKIIQNIY